jgi:hypothetical protein
MKSRIDCSPRRFDERVASTPEEAHALHYRMPDGRKVSGLNWSGSDKPGYVAQAFNTTAQQRMTHVEISDLSERVSVLACTNAEAEQEILLSDVSESNKGHEVDRQDKQIRQISPAWRAKHYGETGKAALKGPAGGWFNDNKRKGNGPAGYLSQSGSKSSARKAASAEIAKIPFPLAAFIARTYYPRREQALSGGEESA